MDVKYEFVKSVVADRDYAFEEAIAYANEADECMAELVKYKKKCLELQSQVDTQIETNSTESEL